MNKISTHSKNVSFTLLKISHYLHKTEQINIQIVIFVISSGTCILDLVYKQICQRGVIVFLGVGRQLRALFESEKGGAGKSNTGVLNMYDLEQSLIDFHINIPQAVSITWHLSYTNIYKQILYVKNVLCTNGTLHLIETFNTEKSVILL